MTTEQIISFETGQPWTASISSATRASSWCSVFPTSGDAGKVTLTLAAQKNDTGDTRSAKLIINAGTQSFLITVTQKSEDALTVTQGQFDVAADGGEVKIEVKHNIDFTYEVDVDCKAWITETKTRAMQTSILKFNIAKNEDMASRKGNIIVKSGALQEIITVKQAGQSSNINEGLSYLPQQPNADKPLSIYFKANDKYPNLKGYTGDVYVHMGVVADGDWQYVPAEWTQNLDKCKMTKLADDIWGIDLLPSIRQWFGSGETPLTKIGLVIRSADGSKKAVDEDLFIAVSDTVYKGFEPAAIKNGTMPTGVQEGINVIDNSTITLVLYDKDTKGNHKDFAHVIGDFNEWKLSNEANCQMIRDEQAGCWWITLSGLDATKEYAYQYYVGNKEGETIRLADAYAEKILDPDNDKYISASTYNENLNYPKGAKGITSVFKIQEEEYIWQVEDFKIENPESLTIYELLVRDFTSKGDLNGVIDKLDYLQSLGINAIELMPVQEFDGNDSWGYNPCFFFAMDKAYGTKKLYKQFIDACHERGIAVILDVVYNHATGNHPFAKLYWDASGNATAANNPWFNVVAPHPYSVFHDFNHESPLVRKFVKRNLQFLLEEYHFDGFRFDLTKGFTQKQSNEGNAGNYDASRVDILKDYYNAITKVNPDAFVILEHFCDSKEENELAAAGIHLWRNLNNAYCQTAMGWWENSSFSGMYEKTPAWVGFMESHDEERMGYKQTQWGNYDLKTNLTKRMKQLATNAAFFLTVPGPKMIWQFGEMGYETSIEENGRTGRKPIHWEYLSNSYRRELQETYAKLLAMRNAHPDLFDEKTSFSWEVDNITETTWKKIRILTSETIIGEKMVVLGNFTDTDLKTAFPATKGEWTNFHTGKSEAVGDSVTVSAHSYLLYTNF
ncbi:MAG: alpha-amylase [Mediterranea massiliensis]|nr:alpha-amylase [Mediterranea massiliensis]